MVGEWASITLGDFISLQRGHDLPEEKRVKGNVPILGSFGITGWHNVAKAKAHGVTIGRSGASFGVVTYSSVDYWPLNTALYVTDFKNNYPKFVFYFLKSIDFTAYNSGSAQPSLNRNHIALIPIKIPPPSEQKAIAHILGSLDDKIELNRQMNATLEAMAQALFKSWFVDFDPVIDNALAAGNPIPDELQSKAAARLALGDAHKPLPTDIQALFPNSFVLTEEMGWIPEGWEVGTIKHLTSVKAGYAYKSADFTNIGVPVIKIKNINSNKSVDVIDVDYVPDSIAQKTKDFWLKTGSLLMAMTGATVGKFGLLVCRDSEYYLLNQRVAKFNTTNSEKLWFVYCNLSLQQNIDFITNAAHGSAQPNISADTISSMPCLLPNNELINLFGQKSNSFFKKILDNKKQIFNLESIRDTLLPKLLSGELRIPE